MEIGAVIRRLGYLMELFQIGSPEMRDRLRERLTETVVRLDPILPAGGKFLHRWRLQLNVTPEELLAAVRTRSALFLNGEIAMHDARRRR